MARRTVHLLVLLATTLSLAHPAAAAAADAAAEPPVDAPAAEQRLPDDFFLETDDPGAVTRRFATLWAEQMDAAHAAWYADRPDLQPRPDEGQREEIRRVLGLIGA